jgi:hypothetical protein
MNLPTSYLKKRTTLQAARRRFDFDSCNSEFKADRNRLKAKRRTGDEIWILEPPKGAIAIWGIALVRKGRIISTLVEAVG